MVGKIVVSLVSLILLVGVIVGVVVVVNKNGDNKEDQNSAVQMKKVHEFCQAADYKDACAKSLEGVAKNESATISDYLMAAFQNTVEEVKKGMEEAGKTNVNKDSDPYNHMAVDDCKQLLQDAVDYLEDALALVGETDTESLHEYTYDLLNWIGGVYSFQTICLDAIDKPEYKSAIEKGLTNATQLTNNAINIIAKMSEVLKSFNIQIPEGLLDNTNSSPHRRLLEVNKVDQDGYPTWFPAADRTVDFIFGKGSALIQNSEIVVRKPMENQKNIITADGRELNDKITGVVLQNCRIVAEREFFADRLKVETYLSRPWKAFSLNVFIESDMGDFIRPEGFMKWSEDPKEQYQNTCGMYEYANRGPAAATNARSKIFKNYKVLSPQEATKYTVGTFLQGYEWLPGTNAPHYLGLGGK
ncbi:hypothetical protein K7X08_008380 [Anisodus acutangulus]|uniref:Pectinesterase inhibitor domain-containing protein n=1 Tax=Anisodus acutangulus TaxID=402998 RepID=A0A9Q1RNT5_9SOLA|nr:hypothetical protein K7X08_008380 [Anisodus acutangulus]